MAWFILGHAEPQNWFNSGVGGGLYSIISGKSAFLRQLLYILTFCVNIFVLKCRIQNQKGKKKEKKKKKEKEADPYFTIFGPSEKGKQTSFFFRPFMTNCEFIIHHLISHSDMICHLRGYTFSDSNILVCYRRWDISIIKVWNLSFRMFFVRVQTFGSKVTIN